MVAVKVENLTKRFNGQVALDNVSFEVDDREFFVLLGRPGAGKTTTLRTIAGLEKPDEGNIYIKDRLVNDVLPSDRDIAMIFQNLALYPAWTVFENMAFTLRVHKVPKEEIEKRVKEVAKTLKIDYLLDRTPATLSGGERQRVAIGRALVRRPSVFLMDEPLGPLDALLRLNMRTELKRLKAELGQTIIYTTPDQLEAMSMGDHIAVIHKGVIQQIGDPETVYSRPVNRFVAGMIGSPSMNFIEGTWRQDGPESILDCGRLKVNLTRFSSVIEKESSGSELVFGIRPEHVRVEHEKTSPEMVEAAVVMEEPLGSETILHVNVDDELVKAVVPPTFSANYGEKVWLEFDMDRMHIIDKKTEKVIV
ncbi:ABC transporter ATP-binding protein [Candidatus Bathyarchaeota archaeon]|nr:ABC transporter ATP-binding protein [Candidatus Bathyarchaeota archaeon]